MLEFLRPTYYEVWINQGGAWEHRQRMTLAELLERLNSREADQHTEVVADFLDGRSKIIVIWGSNTITIRQTPKRIMKLLPKLLPLAT